MSFSSRLKWARPVVLYSEGRPRSLFLQSEFGLIIRAMTPDTSKYLEYLDREMTIMGILSAVSMIAAAGVLNVFMGDKGDIKSDLWEAGQHCIVLGSMVCVVAAGLFYKQRSRLAWFYGQICLLAAAESGTPEAAKLRELFREADSWETWWPYSWGFTFLTAVSSVMSWLLSPIGCILCEGSDK